MSEILDQPEYLKEKSKPVLDNDLNPNRFLTMTKGVQRIFFRGETEGGPPSTQPQPLGLGLPRARNFLIFNLFKRVFRSLFNAFCSNSSYICLNYRYKFLIYTFSTSCLEILGGDSLPPKSLWGEMVSLFSPPLHASDNLYVNFL